MPPKKRCWSCAAAGMSTRARVRNDKGELCLPCFDERRCQDCGSKRQKQKYLPLPRCSECSEHLAVWCSCYSLETAELGHCFKCLVAARADGKKKCWSCQSKRRQNNSECNGCCQVCASQRTCDLCQCFHWVTSDLLPCRGCSTGRARWCRWCFTEETLALMLCSTCSLNPRVRNDGLCWSCEETQAQSDKRYNGCCKACFKARTWLGVPKLQ